MDAFTRLALRAIPATHFLTEDNNFADVFERSAFSGLAGCGNGAFGPSLFLTATHANFFEYYS